MSTPKRRWWCEVSPEARRLAVDWPMTAGSLLAAAVVIAVRLALALTGLWG